MLSPASRNLASSFSLPGLASKRANSATVYITFLLTSIDSTSGQDSSFHSGFAIGKIAKVDIIFAMRIYVLALDGVFDTGLATVLDAFETANELAEMSGLASPRFQVSIVGMRKAVKTSQGLIVPVAAAPARVVPDWVVVPAIGFKMPGPLVAALARSDVSDAGEALRSWAARGAGTAAACIGTFVVAESGLLDNQDSTTTWWLAPLFRQRYPRVCLDESQIILKSERFVTAGAALSH